MKTIIILATLLLLSGCGVFLTPDNVKYSSVAGLCSIADGMATMSTRKIAYDELERRGEVCNYAQNDSAVDKIVNQRRSEALLNFGAQMLNNSQPQPIYGPSQTVCRQQGIYTYCNQY